MIGTVIAGVAAVVALVISIRSYDLSVRTYDLQIADRNERLTSEKREVADRITWWRESYTREAGVDRYIEPLMVVQNSGSEPVSVYILNDYRLDGKPAKWWSSKGVMPPCTIMRHYPLESAPWPMRKKYREPFNKAVYTLYFIEVISAK
ncbi:hypothetical protein [Microtetraspora malaysiensis]|uniref:hypothetical protein n=1 Tax=Microtetraspora malaysiensis TaxID=161358 RepID=UPI003D8A6DFC